MALKKVLYIIVCFIFGQMMFSQSDTIIAIGTMRLDGYAGESIDYYNCKPKYLNGFKKNDILIITDIKECISEVNKEVIKFYEVKYNDNYLFIETEYLNCDKDYFSIINNLTDSERKRFREISSQLAEGQKIKKLIKIDDFLKFSTKQGVVVKKWKIFDESEYTEGTSVEIEFINPTDKIIKYIWTTFIGYNAVEDPVIDRLKGVKNITVKSIGPIKPNEVGSYVFNYVWNTDIVDTANISNIKIQYMDGSFKSITSPNKVIMSDELLKILEEY